jgi:hypothetical protein
MDEPATKVQRFHTMETIVGAGALLLILAVADALHFKVISLTLAQALVGGGALLALPLGYTSYRRYREGKRIERQKKAQYQEALAGNITGLPLAQPQPVPDETALALPYIFKLQRDWRGMAASWGVGVLCIWAYTNTFFINIFDSTGVVGWLLATTIFALAVTTLAFSPLIVMRRQRLEVTEKGLFFGKDVFGLSALQWEEIELFIIPAGVNKRKPLRRYELVGAGYSFFVRRPSRKRFFQFDKPSLPYDEYDRQMDALLSLIAAKTGLSLYDLR